MNGLLQLPISRESVAEFCRRHHIRKLSLFGSVLLDDFSPDSDIDVLVEFEPGHTPGLLFFAIQDELSAILVTCSKNAKKRMKDEGGRMKNRGPF